MDPREITKGATSVGGDPAAELGHEDDGVYLVVLAGFGVGRLFPLAGKSIAIGRDDSADIQIVDAGASRKHARVYWREDVQYIEDLGSRNGTLVNGEAIEEARQLNAGDKLQIGVQTVLRVSRGDEIETRFARNMYDAALRDALTQAYNRRYLDERLAAEVAFSVRHDMPLALLVLDIDRFKQINDSHGHPFGDVVLKQLTELVASTIRAEDVLARYGGEEFVVLCRQSQATQVAILAERIRTKIEAHEFATEQEKVKLTVSIGVADLSCSTSCDGNAMLGAADKALYRAKEQGRNRVVVARPDDGDTAAGT